MNREIKEKLKHLLEKIEDRYQEEYEGHERWFRHFEQLLDSAEKELKEILEDI
jgi:hypothetical protein